jgi:hypothetical protein
MINIRSPKISKVTADPSNIIGLLGGIEMKGLTFEFSKQYIWIRRYGGCNIKRMYQKVETKTKVSPQRKSPKLSCSVCVSADKCWGRGF